MNIEEFREYCLAVKGAEECMPFDNQTLVYKVMGKMFTYVSLQDVYKRQVLFHGRASPPVLSCFCIISLPTSLTVK